MFTTLIVQPIFNVLTLILSIIPGHNFGVAIILFTLLVRIALYPLLKRQLKHTRAIRMLQPEIKKIKEKTKGNRQQESLMTMELYKEHEIKPLSFLGLMVVQIVIFLALFSGLNRIVQNPQEIYDFSYPVIQNTEYMQSLNEDITTFDNTLVGTVDLKRAAIGDQGFYFPAFLLVLGSAITQFVQIRQTMPNDKNGRKLREILKDAGDGKQADSAEVNAAMGRNMSYVLPIIIFIVTVNFAAALALYWFVGGLIAYLQQRYLLKQDEYAMTGPEAKVVSKKPLKDNGVKVSTYTAKSSKKPKTTNKAKSKKSSSKKKRK